MCVKFVKLLTLCMVIAFGLPNRSTHAAPAIFHSTESAAPGDIIGIQGGGFGAAPQVWMQHVLGTETSLAPQVELPLLNSGTTSFLSVQIPPGETAGLYAIWVTDGVDLSAPVYINRARAWGAHDLAGSQVDPGRSFRLFGRNLFLSGTTPAVRFVNGATSLAAVVSGSGNDAYTLNITAPAALVPGMAYTLYVKNGFGKNYGETAAMTLTARTSATDPFGIGTPWGADFTFSANVYNVKTDARVSPHAVGDGVADDRLAIQAAINAANAAGGGVVYMTSGTYRLTVNASTGNALTLKSNVVLKGDGMNVSHLLISGTALSGGSSLQGTSRTLVGFADLDIHNTAIGAGWSTRLDSTSKIFAIRTQFQTDVGHDMIWSNDSQVVISDCSIINTQNDRAVGTLGSPTRILGATDMIFRNNTVSWYLGRVNLGSTRLLIENNQLNRCLYSGTSRAETGGFGIGSSAGLVLLDNTVGVAGSGPVIQNGDGEMVLSQGGGTAHYDFGTATGATSTTLTDGAKNWTFAYGTPDPVIYLQPYFVSIVSGPGMGQFRKIISNTTNTLTLDSPWDILPTNASRYAINPFHNRQNLIKGNVLSNNPQGIMFYKTSIQDVCIVNNTLSNNGGIWLLGTYSPTTAVQCDVQMDTFVAGNVVSRDESTRDWYVGTGTSPRIFSQTGKANSIPADFGTHIFGTEFRNNSITTIVPNTVTGRNGDGFGGLTDEAYDNTTQSTLGVIFSGNTAVNTDDAFHLNTGAYSCAIWRNTASNTIDLLYDGTEKGASHASIDTVQSLTPPAPWLTQDIGAVGATGSSWYAPDGDAFAMKASGADVWGAADSFHFLYQAASGDCEIKAHVAGLPGNIWSSGVGVMIRETLNADSIHVSSIACPSHGATGSAAFVRRVTTGGTTGSNGYNVVPPIWVRVVRSGNTFTSYWGTDGVTWTLKGTVTLPMAANAYIGLAAYSHLAGSYGNFVIDSVSVTP